MPGDLFMERRIRSLVRWNAMAMVMRANDNEDGLGGHINGFSSSATLYDVGMNHFSGNGQRSPWRSFTTRATVRRACTPVHTLKG